MLLVLPFLLWISWRGAAEAHAAVTGTEPADGAVLAEQPAEVVVRFNEPVAVVRAQVLDPSGQDVLAPDLARSDEGGLHLPLPAGLAEGTYTVSYRVVSLDGHPVGGSMVFSVGQVSGVTPAASDANDPGAWRWTLIAAWAVFYLALLGAAGGVLFVELVRPEGQPGDLAQPVLVVAAVLGLVAAVVAVGAQGGLLLDGPATSLLEVRTWATGLQSTFGSTALSATIGFGLISVSALARSSVVSGLLGVMGALVALGSLVLTGHVVTAGPHWLTWPPLLLHAAAAAFWVGSLVPLHRALAGSAEAAGRLLQRFSPVAVGAVGLLVAAGAALTWLQVRRPEALLTTAYGRVLLVKLALFAGLLALAALNRLRLTPALVRGEADAPRRLSWSIAGEVALVATVLTATATLGTTPPPRALLSGMSMGTQDMHAHEEHGHAHAGSSVVLTGDGFTAAVVLEPRENGVGAASIVLLDPSQQPFGAQEVTLRLSNPGRDIAPLVRPAQEASPGLWRVPELVLAIGGEWDVEVDVLVSDFERQTVSGAFDVR